MFRYTVGCSLPDIRLETEWVNWLLEEHFAQVLAAGARAVELVRLDGDEIRYEARYEFASREAFQAYERDAAPFLRAEGLHRFPAELGLAYSRTTGEVIARVVPNGG